LLKGHQIGVLGYGSQGRAQALNLRDSGFEPIVGLPAKSATRKLAKNDGFDVTTPDKAALDSTLIAVLVPDHKHAELFTQDLPGAVRSGQTYIFAHALSVHFGLVEQPPQVDFVLVAPHGPGIRLREKYVAHEGLTAFVGRTPDSSDKSLGLALAYGKAIGCARAGLLETTFANEAIGDIFGEQVVLCGGLSGLLKSGFDMLVKAKIPPVNAYIECVYQLDLIVDLIKRYGISGMYDRISTTAAFGSLLVESQIINRKSRKAMAAQLKKIQNGDFIRELTADYRRSFKNLRKFRKKKRPKTFDKVAQFVKKELGDD